MNRDFSVVTVMKVKVRVERQMKSKRREEGKKGGESEDEEEQDDR